ncbi:MAG: PQQ-dependent sugar dehydrogenase, partial [SAR202 cluster bacterium]|nr:PQQ-dependent sugar dehydrogenase [SAR202 cluster bacterium]
MIKIIISVSIICFLLIFAYVLWHYWYIFPPSFIDVVRDVRDDVFGLVSSTPQDPSVPPKYSINDNDFVIEEYASGLHQPTAIEFVGDNIIVLEKNNGKVLLIEDGEINDNPLLDFNVNSYWESGLLGVTVNGNNVYFYLTEAEEDGGERIGNNIYQFYWDGENFTDKYLVNSLGLDQIWHNGGAMTTGLDGQVYAVIGDQGAGLEDSKIIPTLAQNNNEGEFNDTGVIIKVGLDKEIIKPKNSENPLEHYYAIGIRNSFGLTIDPVTGNLWETENGPEYFDEVNLVTKNFNSGW